MNPFIYKILKLSGAAQSIAKTRNRFETEVDLWVDAPQEQLELIQELIDGHIPVAFKVYVRPWSEAPVGKPGPI